MTTTAPFDLFETLYRKNSIINGNFDFWQRGTSHSNIGFGSADRWAQWYSDGTTCTVSQQTFTVGQTEVPNFPTYYLRMTPSGGNGVGYGNIYQTIEGVESHSDSTITVSFWARASVAGEKIQIGWTQKFGTGGTPSSRVDPPTRPIIALTTSWKKYAVTFDIPSIEGKTLGTSGTDSLYLDIAHTSEGQWPKPTGTFDIAQVQLEEGDTATDFEHRLHAEEFALCQRYYEVGTVYFIGFPTVVGAYVGSRITYNTKKFKAATVALGTPTQNVNNNGPSITVFDDTGFRIFAQATVASANVYYTNTFTADGDQG